MIENLIAEPVLASVLKCPGCDFEKEEIMPTDSCLYFYQCLNCQVLLKPKPGDCCVFCSFGTVACPSKQSGHDCCVG